MISTSDELLAQEQLSHDTGFESGLIEQFTSRLRGAKQALPGKRPWVMVTPIRKGQTLLSVYQALKLQGEFEGWSSEFYDVRKDTGVCVLALMP